MTRWPTRFESQVCPTEMTPVAIEMAIIPPTSQRQQRRVAVGDRVVEDVAQQKRRDHPEAGADRDEPEHGPSRRW